jgi:hypothetical protein
MSPDSFKFYFLKLRSWRHDMSPAPYILKMNVITFKFGDLGCKLKVTRDLLVRKLVYLT